jgi:hypothetical protein
MVSTGARILRRRLSYTEIEEANDEVSVKLRAVEVSEQSLRRFMFRNDRLNYSFCVYPDASKLQYYTQTTLRLIVNTT